MCPLSDSAGGVSLQPAAELPHVRGHEHGQHVLGALTACAPNLYTVACAPLAPPRCASFRGPHLAPHRACALFLTRQYASAFNQPLSFDISSVTWMAGMFEVRPPPVPRPQPVYSPVACAPLAAAAAPHALHAAFQPTRQCQLAPTFDSSPFDSPRLSTRPAFHMWLATIDPPTSPASHVPSSRLGAQSNSVYPLSLSNANKLVIRCAWKGNTAWDNYYLGSVSPNGLSGLSWGTAGRCKEGRKEEGKDIYVFG